MKRFNVNLFNNLIGKNAVLGNRVMHYDRVDSTMIAAREAVRVANLKIPGPVSTTPNQSLRKQFHGVTLVAEEQTAGQGRRGRLWSSRPGNLFFTLIWMHEPDVEQFSTAIKLNFATPLAVVLELRSLGRLL
jgi:biotin-(acetyl-CoA carboxylase) ligase